MNNLTKWLDTVTFDILSFSSSEDTFAMCFYVAFYSFLFGCFVFSFCVFLFPLTFDSTLGMYVVLSSLV